MSLNLGNVTKNVSDDMSLENKYIEWLEADQQFMNFMNAMEIIEKAQASGSNECISFAEELLGCSCEAVLSGSAAHIGKHAISAMRNAYVTAQKLEKILRAISMFTTGGNSPINITAHLKITAAFSDATDYNENSIKFLSKPPVTNTIQVSLSDAMEFAGGALRVVKYALGYANGNAGPAAKNAKKFKDSLKNEKTKDKSIETYSNIRKSIAVVFKDVRSIINALKTKHGIRIGKKK